MGLQQILRDRLVGFVIDSPAGALSRVTTSLGGMPSLALAAAVVVGVIGLLALPLRWLRRRSRARVNLPGPYTALHGGGREEMRKGYREALRLLRGRGYPPRMAHQSPQEYLTVAPVEEKELRRGLEQITEWVAAASYDPRPFDAILSQRARDLLRRLAGRPSRGKETLR